MQLAWIDAALLIEYRIVDVDGQQIPDDEIAAGGAVADGNDLPDFPFKVDR